MTDLAAAMGRVQLRKLESSTEGRREVAGRYNKAFAGLPGVVTPEASPHARHVYHQYTIRLRHRDAVQRRLLEQDVESTVFYPIPTHRLPAYDTSNSLPETDRAAEEVLSLPMRHTLTDEEVDRVVTAVQRSVEVDDA